MIVPNSLAAACGGPAPSGAAGRKTDQDQSDKHDFGAELGALLATLTPPPNPPQASAPAPGGAQTSVLKASALAIRKSSEMTGTAVTSSHLTAAESSPVPSCAQPFAGLTPGNNAGMSSLLQPTTSASDNVAGAMTPLSKQAAMMPLSAQAASVDLIAGRAVAQDAVQPLPEVSDVPGPGQALGKPLADRASSIVQAPLVGSATLLQVSPVSRTAGRTEFKTQPAISSQPDSERPNETPRAPSREVAARPAEHRADASTASEPEHPAMPAQAALDKSAGMTTPASTPQSVHTPATTVAPLASNVGSGAAPASHPTHAIAPVSSIAPPRPASDVPQVNPPPRTAVLKIDLADGATAHAHVSERAGAVDVRVVTNNSPVAQHVANQFGGLRRALDGAGLRLVHAGVSYRDEGRSGHRDQRQDHTRAQPPQQSGEKQFAEYEVH